MVTMDNLTRFKDYLISKNTPPVTDGLAAIIRPETALAKPTETPILSVR
jgi:hypothetical protein